MRAVVFAGPSLPSHVRPTTAAIEWRPPVRQGDVYRAALTHPAIIGIIDGYFEVTPTVWHKEILWAMAQGIHIYGAASIGALRAAELDAFGMKGVGRIYEMYRDGVLQDDDEVAVLHGPEELGYVPLTEAMVDLRATVEEAVKVGILQIESARLIAIAAKLLFYKDRTLERILDAAHERGLSVSASSYLRAWLDSHKVSQKQLDAIALVGCIGVHLSATLPSFAVAFDFAHTAAWDLVKEGTRRAQAFRARDEV
jgi:hypothetical protein